MRNVLIAPAFTFTSLVRTILIAMIDRNTFTRSKTTFVKIYIICILGSVFYFIHSYPSFTQLSEYSSGCGDSNARSSAQRGASAFLAASESIHQRFLKKRKELLIGKKPLEEIKPWNLAKEIYFWNYFPPTITCPHLIERIGKPSDGGKWVCGFDLFTISETSKPCIVYSFGVSYESSFEEEFLRRTNCSVFAYDFTVDKLSLSEIPEKIDPSRVHFTKKGIWGKDEEKSERFNTLGELMRKNGHEWIDYLKVDVEGAEYAALEQIMREFPTLPFGHLNVEIHLKQFTDAEFKKENEQFQKFLKWWTKLEESGLRAFFWEDNYHPVLKHKNPTLMEYAFLNVKELKLNQLLQF